MISDNLKVNLVNSMYCEVASLQVDRKVRNKVPRLGNTSYESAVLFYENSSHSGISLFSYMLYAFQIYTSWWKSKFGKEYPPLAFLTSQKVRTRLLVDFARPVRVDSSSLFIDLYLPYLRGFDKKTAIELINAGFCGGSEKIKERLLAEIEASKT